MKHDPAKTTPQAFETLLRTHLAAFESASLPSTQAKEHTPPQEDMVASQMLQSRMFASAVSHR